MGRDGALSHRDGGMSTALSSTSTRTMHGRAGGTGPAAPVLAGPIFEAPTIFLTKT